MIYEFRCQGDCKKLYHVSMPLSEHETYKRTAKCCGLPVKQEFSPPKIVFARAPFPKGTEIVEHCMDEPIVCKDKKQLEDICAETNSVSRYLEDDV